MKHSKEEYIGIFREQADKIFADLLKSKLSLNSKASEMNKRIKSFKEIQFSKILQVSKSENWSTEALLNELLLLTYSSYIVMLEFRNDIWLYEYMSFARRIGELWEPFCKLPFYYPIKKLNLIEPPEFFTIQQKIQSDADNFIDTLNLDDKIKRELKQKYEIPWTMVDSGGINLNFVCILSKTEYIIIATLKVVLVLMKKEIQKDFYLLLVFLIILGKTKNK